MHITSKLTSNNQEPSGPGSAGPVTERRRVQTNTVTETFGLPRALRSTEAGPAVRCRACARIAQAVSHTAVSPVDPVTELCPNWAQRVVRRINRWPYEFHAVNGVEWEAQEGNMVQLWRPACMANIMKVINVQYTGLNHTVSRFKQFSGSVSSKLLDQSCQHKSHK